MLNTEEVQEKWLKGWGPLLGCRVYDSTTLLSGEMAGEYLKYLEYIEYSRLYSPGAHRARQTA